MQPDQSNVEKNLIAEMERLIVSIKERVNQNEGIELDEKALIKRLKYRSENYISECRSRGVVSPKFIEKLQTYLESLENSSLRKVEEMPSHYQKKDPEVVSRERLEITLQNLSEDKIRSTAIMERLVALLEKQLNLNTTSLTEQQPPAVSEQGPVQPIQFGKTQRRDADSPEKKDT